MNVVCHVRIEAAWGFQGPRGILSWFGSPGFVNVARIAFVQNDHAILLGDGCCGHTYVDLLVCVRWGRVEPRRRASCSSRLPVWSTISASVVA